MKKRLILSAMFFVWVGMHTGLMAQQPVDTRIDINSLGYFNDALRFSQTTFAGSGRFQGIGGAGVALGGDISSALVNPAGLGFIRKSEFATTLNLGINNANTTFLSNRTSDSKNSINLPNIGAVFASPKENTIGHMGGSWAISGNRINDFNNNITYSGVNTSTQIVDAFLQLAEGIPWTELDFQTINGATNVLGMAYLTYLINPDLAGDPGTLDTYATFLPLPSEAPTTQTMNINTTGSQYEWNISYGGNYDDTFYYGFGLGINTLRYERNREYRESVQQPNPIFNDLLIFDQLIQSGIGVNARAGVIFRPVDAVRIGISAVTPTWLRITESYGENMFVRYNNFRFSTGLDNNGNEQFITLNNERADVIFDDIAFSLRTPARISGGLAVFLGKRGFLSADVEYVAYGSARLNNPRDEFTGQALDFDFNADNRVMNNVFNNAVNIRVGGEARLKDFRVRGGFAHYGDPYSFNNRIGTAQIFATGGLGYRNEKFYIDLTGVQQMSQSQLTPYNLLVVENGRDVDIAPAADVRLSRLRAMVSFGIFF
jgi:hypothetical protein